MAFADPEIYAKYEKLAARAKMEAIPGFEWCMAQGCDAGQVHNEEESGPKFVCDACKGEHCVAHKVPWHNGDTCEQYESR
jgi:hypothetical protein